MTPRRIVITGATGFTGPFVTRALRARFPGAAITCLVRPSSRLDVLHGLDVTTARGDLRDVASLRAAFADADTLVNVASLGFDWIDPLFEAVRGSSLRRGVFIGTTAMLTKLPVASRAVRERGEALVRSSGLDWTILRPTMIYGTPADRNISRLIRFVLRSPVIPLTARNAIQQPVHVEDVAQAVASALASEETAGRAYNIAGRDAVTLEKMVRTVIEIAGVRRAVLPLPSSMVRSMIALHERVSRRPVLRTEQIDRLQEDKGFDYAEAVRDFAYAPRSLKDGLRAELTMIREGRNV